MISDIKRFPLPEPLTYTCPSCESTVEHCRYLDYPRLNEVVIANMYCEACECEFEAQIRVRVYIERFSIVDYTNGKKEGKWWQPSE